MSDPTLFLFGLPRIERNGVPIEVNPRKALALLAYLAITGKSYSRDSLSTFFWPEFDQKRARDSLRRTLPTLRKALPEEWLNIDRDTIGLDGNNDFWIDVNQFHLLLSQCQNHGHPASEVCSECPALLREAVNLYKDDFMAGYALQDSLDFDDWQASQFQNLRSEMTGALKRLVVWHSGRGEFDPAIEYAQRWLELEKMDEDAHRHLMRLYASVGRRTDALRQYEQCQKIIDSELGASPQEETVRLFEAIVDDTFSPVIAPSSEEASPVKEDKTELEPLNPPDTPINNRLRPPITVINQEDDIEEKNGSIINTYSPTLNRKLQERARRAMVGYAFYRWESAITISTTVLLTFLSFLFKDSSLVPDWAWIGWLLFGLAGETLLVFTSLTDPETGRRIVNQMLQDEFKPEKLSTTVLREKVEKAFDYRSRIEAAIRKHRNTILKNNLDKTSDQVNVWIENIYNLVQRLDDYYGEKDVLQTDKDEVSHRVNQLQDKLLTQSDPKMVKQIQANIKGMNLQLQTIEGLERTMEKADLQLEHTLSALGTIYSQTIMVEAKDIDSGHAKGLRQEISQEVKELGYLLSAMDEVYTLYGDPE